MPYHPKLGLVPVVTKLDVKGDISAGLVLSTSVPLTASGILCGAKQKASDGFLGTLAKDTLAPGKTTVSSELWGLLSRVGRTQQQRQNCLAPPQSRERAP